MTARLGKQARSQETRQKLVLAAIEVLATVGYAATTMARVAQVAGVSPGPRQYYFPRFTDLFVAVVEHVHADLEARVAAFEHLTDPAERIRVRFGAVLANVASPSHMAMLELKMACRGDAGLRDAIGPTIRAFEERADERFLAAMRSTGLPDPELLALRAMMAATLRGLAIASIDHDQTAVLAEVERILPEMVIARLKAGSKRR